MIAQKGGAPQWRMLASVLAAVLFVGVLGQLMSAEHAVTLQRAEIARLRKHVPPSAPVVRLINPSVRDYADLYEHFRACGIAMAKIQNTATAERYGALRYHPYFPKAPK